jgi:hypothetical protein
MSPNLGRHCVSLRHRRVPDTPNLYQLQPTITNQPKRTGILATIEFLCLSSNNNHEITDMSGIPRHVVKCRVVLDTLPTRHFLVSATWPAKCRDMSPTRHRMSPFGQQKRHANIRHNGLREECVTMLLMEDNLSILFIIYKIDWCPLFLVLVKSATVPLDPKLMKYATANIPLHGWTVDEAISIISRSL